MITKKNVFKIVAKNSDLSFQKWTIATYKIVKLMGYFKQKKLLEFIGPQEPSLKVHFDPELRTRVIAKMLKIA